MARSESALVNWSQYLSARVAASGLTSFDTQANLRTAAALGRLLYRLDRRHRQRAEANLRLAFPEWRQAQIEATARASFEHFLQLAIEVLHTPRQIHEASWPRYLRIRNLSPALERLNARQPLILLTGHLGNWEVLGYLLAVVGYDLDAIARPIDNPLIDRWLLGIRERKGMRIITKWDATERMLRVLDEGGGLGFIADQNAGDRGLFVPFFGKLASTYKSIGLLAMRKRVPVVCGYAHRIGHRFEYELGVSDIIHPHDWEGRDEPLYYITARYSRAIEQMVRMQPHQYLWMHRRWKSRPRHEKEGKPLPDRLRRQLESLPWMEQATMRRVEEGIPK